MSPDPFLKNIVVLTGAGVSQESGIPTFRGAGGLWEGKRIEEVASPQGFATNPQLVHEFYNMRRRQLQDPTIQPNAAHRALAGFVMMTPPHCRKVEINFESTPIGSSFDDTIQGAASVEVPKFFEGLLDSQELSPEKPA